MSSDQEVDVKFGAEIKGLLEGIKSAQEHLGTATEGMRGDIGALIESFESLGVAALGVGVLGLAFEGLRELVDFVPEAIKEVGELTETFKGLAITANMDTDAFNGYLAAIQMSGGKAEDLASIVQGMARGIKANSDVLVENLHLTDKAALSHMTLAEYIHKVVQTMDTYKDANEKNQLMMAAFGRSGMKMAAMLVELDKNMGEGVEQGKRYSQVTEDLVEKETELTKAKGELTIATNALKAAVAADYIEMETELTKTKAAILGTTQSIEQLTHAKLAAQAVKLVNEGKIQDSGKEVKWGAGAEDHTFERTAADWDILIQRAKDYNTAQSQEKTKTEAGKKGHFTSKEDQTEAAAAAKATAEAEEQAQAAIQKMRDRDIQEAQQHQDQADQRAMEAHEKSVAEAIKLLEQEAKEKTELAKLGAQAQLNASRSVLEGQKLVLEQEVALGGINIAEEISQRKDLLAQENAIETRALQSELLNLQLTLVERTKIENQILALHAKNNLEMQKLDNQLAQNDKRIMDQMSNGWDSYIQKGLQGTNSLVRTFEGATRQMGDSMEKALINMGLDWVKFELLKRTEGQKSHLEQNFLSAKTAAGNAWSSAADIPVVGWILAPVAAAAAFAGVMAFAEGGWDNVPSDQVAMIHKQEMVLPASLAEGARQTFAAAAAGGGGGNGGGGVVHIHAVDGKSVERLARQHGGALLKGLGMAARNGRFS